MATKKAVSKKIAPKKAGTLYHFTDLPGLIAISGMFKSAAPYLQFGKELSPIDKNKPNTLIISTTTNPKLEWANVRIALDVSEVSKNYVIKSVVWDPKLKQDEERIFAKSTQSKLWLKKFAKEIVISLNPKNDTHRGYRYDIRHNQDVIESARKYFTKLGINFKTTNTF